MITDNKQPILVVLCKRPKIGQGKQRLAESIGAKAAYRVAEALFACALEDACAWPGSVVFSPSTAEDIEWLRTQLAAVNLVAEIIPQVAGNLGIRINALDQQLREQGLQRLVYIGTDAPGLSSAHYQNVCTELQRHDVVLSRAGDGGLVIMAANRPWPDFTDLAWSTDHLGAEVESSCQQYNYRIGFINDCYDIDIIDDILLFMDRDGKDVRPARRHLSRLLKEEFVADYESR